MLELRALISPTRHSLITQSERPTTRRSNEIRVGGEESQHEHRDCCSSDPPIATACPKLTLIHTTATATTFVRRHSSALATSTTYFQVIHPCDFVHSIPGRLHPQRTRRCLHLSVAVWSRLRGRRRRARGRQWGGRAGLRRVYGEDQGGLLCGRGGGGGEGGREGMKGCKERLQRLQSHASISCQQ